MENKVYIADDVLVEKNSFGDILIRHITYNKDNTIGGYVISLPRRTALELASYIVDSMEGEHLEEGTMRKLNLTRQSMLKKRTIQLEDDNE